MQLTQQVYVAEGMNEDSWLKARAASQSQLEAEASLGQLKEEHARTSEELKSALTEKRSLEAGLKNAEKQAEEQRGQLRMSEINLETERELVKGLRAELQKAKATAQVFEQNARLAKEAVEAERKAAYQMGVETTTSQLVEQFASVSRDYCLVSWGKALDAPGVSADSELRLPGSVYYHPEIRELPETDLPATQTPETLQEQPDDKGKPAEPANGSGKEKVPTEAKDQASKASERTGHVADPGPPPAKE